MPDFIYNNKVYYNPVEFAMDRIGGTWKMPILWRLQHRRFRFSELKKDIPPCACAAPGQSFIFLDASGKHRARNFPSQASCVRSLTASVRDAALPGCVKKNAGDKLRRFLFLQGRKD